MIDLRGYLQEDMKQFLDNRLSVDYLKQQSTSTRIEDSAGFSRDFEEELFTALQKHDVYQAKKILHDVRDLFATYPVGSSERRQLEAILKSLYEKFREYIETESTLNKLEEGIMHADDPNFFDKEQNASQNSSIPLPEQQTKQQEIRTNVNTALPAQKKETNASFQQQEQKIIRASQEKEAREETLEQPKKHLTKEELDHYEDLETKLMAMMTRIKTALKNNSQETKILYSQAKKLYAQLPANKKRIYQEELLQCYQKIISLPNTKQKTVQKSFQQGNEDLDVHKEFEKTINTLQEAAKEENISQIKEQYKILKDQYAQLSKEEQKKHQQTILILHKQITNLFEKHLPSKEKKPFSEEKNKSLTTDSSASISREKQTLYTKEKQLRSAIQEGDLHQAMTYYEDLREIIHNLPSNQQQDHIGRAHTYYDWLMKAWKQYHATHPTIERHEKRLTGKP